jgi:murein DD-endopeptidase MepM/ murein hydrolase activator NlpD
MAAACLVGAVVVMGVGSVGTAQTISDPPSPGAVTTTLPEPSTTIPPLPPEVSGPLDALLGQAEGVVGPLPVGDRDKGEDDPDDSDPGTDPDVDPDPDPLGPPPDEVEPEPPTEPDTTSRSDPREPERVGEVVETAAHTESRFLHHLAVTAGQGPGSAEPIPAGPQSGPSGTPGWGFVDVAWGPRSTAEIFDLLRAARASAAATRLVVAPFPVAGPARYSNDWGAPRHTPRFHAHEGTDIFASRGTPVLASGAGVVTRVGRRTAVGGNSVTVTAPDGTYLYYAHLDGFAPGITEGARVEFADPIGFVGTTGNAEGGLPHLHFEIHPGGGPPVPPLPFLDDWLAQALTKARSIALGGNAALPDPAPRANAPVLVLPAAAPGDLEDGSVVPGLVMLAVIGLATIAWRGRSIATARLAALADSLWPRRQRTPPTLDILEALHRVQERARAGRRDSGGQPSTSRTVTTVMTTRAPADEGTAARRRARPLRAPTRRREPTRVG